MQDVRLLRQNKTKHADLNPIDLGLPVVIELREKLRMKSRVKQQTQQRHLPGTRSRLIGIGILVVGQELG
jgi:hypothetical protein